MSDDSRINTPEDLQALKKKYAVQIGTRAIKKPSDTTKEVVVGMATCGIASGADDTLNAVKDELKILALDDVKVIETGCIGYCHHEPVVQVNMPGKEPVYYEKVDVEKAREIVRKHVSNGEYLEGSIVNFSFREA